MKEGLRFTWDRAWFWTSSCGTKQRATSFLVHRRESLAYVTKKSRIGFFIKSIPIMLCEKKKNINLLIARTVLYSVLVATPQVDNAPCAMRSWCVATFESPLDMVYRLSRGKDYLSEAWAELGPP